MAARVLLLVVTVSGVQVALKKPAVVSNMLPAPLLRRALNKNKDVTHIGDLRVPSLALGTIAWTPEKEEEYNFLPGDALNSKIGTSVSQSAVADVALKSGLCFFDTAERYSVGEGERLLAAAVGKSPLKGIVATKFTPAPWRLGAESVVEACEASLERLNVPKIDLYQLHMPDVVQPGRCVGYVDEKDEAYWEGLARCVELGMVNEVGVSNYGPTKLRECAAFLARRGVNLASNQIHYSLLARTTGNNQATVDAGKELGVKTLAYYPLAMGLLSSRGREKDGPLSHYSRGGTGLIGVPWVPSNVVNVPGGGVGPLLDAMEDVGRRHGKTPSQVALNWVICNDVIPIVGATTKEYVLDAKGALGWRMSESDRKMLERTADDLGFEFQGTFFKRVDSKFVGYGVEKWTLD